MRREILLGNGDGTFQAPQSFAVGTSPQTFSVADMDLDQKLDLVVVNRQSNDVSILLGRGDGSFGAATTLAVMAAHLGKVSSSSASRATRTPAPRGMRNQKCEPCPEQLTPILPGGGRSAEGQGERAKFTI